MNNRKLDWINKGTLLATIILIISIPVSYYYEIPKHQNRTQSHYDGSLNMTTWQIAYNFTTNDAFSTYSDIELMITANPTSEYYEKFPSKLNQVNTLQIHLADAIPIDPEFKNGNLLHAVIPLTLNEHTRTWEGKTSTIQYQIDGNKCAIITENQRLKNTIGGCGNRDPIIQILPYDVTYQIQTNKLIFALTLVFIIGIIFSFRNFLIQLLHISDSTGSEDNVKDNKHKKTPTKSKGKTKNSTNLN